AEETQTSRFVPSVGAPFARGPGAARLPGRGVQQPQAEGADQFRDPQVVAGEAYSYKVRTVAANTYPQAGGFTEPLLVKVDPRVDFRFARSLSDKVGFDVAKMFPGGVRTETFWVSVGQEIGGIVQDPMTGEVLNFSTGHVMVDFHKSVVLAGVGVTDRVVYADPEGSLHVRLRGETGSGIWEQKAAAAPGRRPRAPAGPGFRGPSPF
ncbi:MAG: hypothetical protein ACYS8K_06160, partial [Planctomycetota bacterium]